MATSPPILVTGAAGFIGFSFCRRLLARGAPVVGLDNLSPYYDPALKQARLSLLKEHPGFEFVQTDIAERKAIADLFVALRPARVVHLAAQAGVRYSLTDPCAYGRSNLIGFLHILEGCRSVGVEHLLYASSSSVYGGNVKTPFATGDNADHPLSLYAATKRANELMAHSYSHLFSLPMTGLRFFTVYGPWGRPDMALFLFARSILEGKPIELFNNGAMRRDFTYIDDVVEGMERLLDRIPSPGEGDAGASAFPPPPCRIFNIGNSAPVELLQLVALLEKALGRKAHTIMKPMQPGDVPATFADVGDLMREIDFCPRTSLEDGVEAFVAWYRTFYQV